MSGGASGRSPVVVLQPVDVGKLVEAARRLDLGGSREFLDDLGGRQRVAHFGVDAYQEIHLVAVRPTRIELLFSSTTMSARVFDSAAKSRSWSSARLRRAGLSTLTHRARQASSASCLRSAKL